MRRSRTRRHDGPTAFGRALLVFLALAGCGDERRYVGDIHQVAMTANTPAAFQNDRGALFVVEKRIELPIRRPTDTELNDLRLAAQGYEVPYPRLPFVERGDIELEISFVLSNLDARAHDVSVIVNGFNEFDEYVPGVVEIDEEPVPEFSQWEKLYRLEPQQRIEWTIREEELDEVAVDLATVVNGVDNPNQVVFFENKSASDDRAKPFIPEVVPALMGVRLGLRASDAGNVLLEATLRVRDLEDMLADDGDRVFEVDPRPFTPSTVMAEAP